MLMSDFELALIQATALNFLNASHKGCYYHFKQAIWRKVQSLGLVEEYKVIYLLFFIFTSIDTQAICCEDGSSLFVWLG